MKALPEGIPRLTYRTRCADSNDTLGWTHGQSIEVYGVTIGLRSNQAEGLKRMLAVVPPGTPSNAVSVDTLYSLLVGSASERKGVKNYHLLYDGCSRTARTLDLDECVSALTLPVTTLLTLTAKDRVFLAAETFEWKGRGALVVANSVPPLAGLREEVLKRGGQAWSPEVTAIDPDGKAFRSVGGGSKSVLPVDLILFTDLEEGAWRPRKMSPSQAVLEFVSRTRSTQVNPDLVLETLTHLSKDAVIYTSRRGGVRKIVDFLERSLRSSC